MADGARLRAALAQVRDDELIALARDLVRIPSVVTPGHPHGNEAAVAEYVQRWFIKEGFELDIQPVAPSRPNVVAWLGDKAAGRSLLLEGHCEPEQNELCLDEVKELIDAARIYVATALRYLEA